MPVKFTTERTLGRVTKWLRMLGFDTRVESKPTNGSERTPELDRYILTRTRKRFEQLRGDQCLFIQSNEPFRQLKEVIRALEISKEDINPFSRCLVCNTPIVPIAKETARHIVPDHIWENCNTFRRCQKCRKIYWPGSHTEHGMEWIEALFG